MFHRKAVVRDTRSIFRRAFYKIKSYITNDGLCDMPTYQVCYERTNELTRNVTRVAFIVIVAFGSVVFHQTVQPVDRDYTYQTAQTQVPQTEKPQQVLTHDFPIEKADNKQQQRLQLVKTQQAKQCLAKNIYFEARSESMKGRMAVALVTLNRVESDKFPDTVCDVVWQEKQFSWTHDGLSDEPNESRAWKYSQKIADFLLTGNNHRYVKDFTDNATYYHANYVSPYWEDHYTKTASVGLHEFYSDES